MSRMLGIICAMAAGLWSLGILLGHVTTVPYLGSQGHFGEITMPATALAVALLSFSILAATFSRKPYPRSVDIALGLVVLLHLTELGAKAFFGISSMDHLISSGYAPQQAVAAGTSVLILLAAVTISPRLAWISLEAGVLGFSTSAAILMAKLGGFDAFSAFHQTSPETAVMLIAVFAGGIAMGREVSLPEPAAVATDGPEV